MVKDTICITVIFALPEEQRLFSTEVPKNATVKSAIDTSGILGWYPEIDLTVNKIGIYGKIVTLDHLLAGGERIEIYRPMTADPKAARKKRAEE
jgi:putative ubiquitin-RnfH superfamily antitoxin RatB of RatAB toxin-antitoxin module